MFFCVAIFLHVVFVIFRSLCPKATMAPANNMRGLALSACALGVGFAEGQYVYDASLCLDLLITIVISLGKSKLSFKSHGFLYGKLQPYLY